MHAYLQMRGGLLGINLMNLVLKILMEDMTVSQMVVVVAGGLVIMAKMEDKLMDVVVAIVFILMMKNLLTLISKEGFDENPFANDGLHRWLLTVLKY